MRVIALRNLLLLQVPSKHYEMPSVDGEVNLSRVIVVGAGPVGLLTSIRLAKEGIPVTLLEAQAVIEVSPRAAGYFPPVIAELDRAGVLQDCLKIGSKLLMEFRWRSLDGDILSAMSYDDLTDDDRKYRYALMLGQHLLAEVILHHLKGYKNAEILFNHAVTGVSQSAEEVVVTSISAVTSETKTFRGQYLCGCDGGKSTVRKLTGTSFNGFTWPVQLMSTNVVGYPFEEYNKTAATDYVVDPHCWGHIARISERENMWRVNFGVKHELSDIDMEDTIHEAYTRLFPRPKSMGTLQKNEYTVTLMSPYLIHQRRCGSFRTGRILLAGDAAHLTNP